MMAFDKNLPLPRDEEEFSGHHFESDDDVINTVDHFLEVQDANSYK